MGQLMSGVLLGERQLSGGKIIKICFQRERPIFNILLARNTWGLGDLHILRPAHDVPVHRVLALQLDAQAQVVNRVGVLQGFLVGNHVRFE